MIRRFESEHGQTVIEFALILPLFLACLFGIIEFSLVMYDRAMVINASREGARAGVVFRADAVTGVYTPISDAEIQNVVTNYLANHLVTFGSSNPLSVQVAPRPSNISPVDVTVTYQYTFLVVPRLLMAGFNGIPLTAQTIMRSEYR